MTSSPNTAHGQSLALLPDGWKDPVGYANGILAPQGRVVFVGGMIGWNADEEFEATDLVSQFGQALKNLVAVVEKAGGKPEHVCRITAFCTDKAAYLDGRKELGPVWREHMGRHYPAMSLVFVSALLEDDAVIELEATAVIPDNT